MARKTNYAFDRNNRAKAKAAKREAKRQAKLAAKAEKAAGTSAEQIVGDTSAQSESAEDGHDERVDEAIPPGSS
jgi:hypothetical protein